MMSPVRLSRLKRLFVGSPLPTAQSRHERLARSTALAVFASDALAGTAALTSAVPALFPYRPWLCVAAVVAIAVANLRGIRESGKIFAAPTYLFIGSLGVLIIYGGLGAVFDFLPEAPYQRHPP